MSIYRQGPTPAGACPRCRESLLDIANVPGIRRCEKCGGVFADNDVSQRVVRVFDRIFLEVGFATSQGKPRANETGHALTCPECLVAMQKIRIESAACHIDACPAHGSWFDPGELADVMRAYKRAREAGVRPPPSPGPTPPPPDVVQNEVWLKNDGLPLLVDVLRDALAHS
jgi:Zn-finger nucleic acid-binding protein